MPRYSKCNNVDSYWEYKMQINKILMFKIVVMRHVLILAFMRNERTICEKFVIFIKLKLWYIVFYSLRVRIELNTVQ